MKSDVEADLEALRAGAAWVDRSAFHLRRFVGAGRVSFLHKYCTQEVRRAPGEGAYGCVLTVKGGLLGDLTVYLREDDLLALCPEAAAEGIYRHLGKYALFDDVRMEDLSAEWAVRGLWGPGARELLAAFFAEEPPAVPYAHRTHVRSEGAVVLARNDAFGLIGWDLIGPREVVAACEEALCAAGARRVGPEAVNVVRVEEGVPLYGVDLDAKTLPLEAGLVEKAVSYEKGCYLGQEVVARATHRGRVNRHLRGVVLEAAVEVPAPVRAEGEEKELGRITSAARSPRRGGAPVGMGLLHRKVAAEGTRVRVGPEEVPGVVCSLPFAPPEA
ncbi:MAG: aminomethyl transferase family protein [Planctomycetota bacterium]|nr:MAG: aminomethyl transferase family protein [Planctomycetota bacterium]